jgi:hypothetical protein
MRKLLFAMLLCCSTVAGARVTSIEFNFSPFTGDIKADHVKLVAGKAVVFVNNVPIAMSDVEAHDVPVIFANREVGSAVWVTAGSMGPALRRGKNKIRIEFTPAGGGAYSAQMRWASVTDKETKMSSGNTASSTNQADEGAEVRAGSGKMVFERSFDADFAADLPWQHYAAVTALTDADKQALAALAAARATMFKPDFSAVYQKLKETSTPGLQLDLAGIRSSKVLDKGYAAGVRVVPPTVDKIDFVLTGNPEVVVRGKTAEGLYPIDEKAIRRVKGEEVQMGLGMVLGVLYPPQFVAVKDPAGKWVVVY